MIITGTNRGVRPADDVQLGKGDQDVWDFIRASAGDLRALNTSTEGDFLSVGAYLHELSSKTSTILRNIELVVGIVTGEGVRENTERLQEVRELINAYHSESRIVFEQQASSLVKILTALDIAHSPLSILKRITKHLHVLSVSIRIEDARLNDGDNFGMLSEQVEMLAGVIAQKIEAIFELFVSLREAVQRTLPGVNSARHAIDDRTAGIVHSLASGVSILVEKRTSSAQTATTLSRRSEEVYSNISDVISFLQFQDISRQQIEHVIETFDELSIEGQQGLADDIVCVLSELGALQIEQLDHARGEISRAVETIVDRLQAITGGLSAVLHDTDALIRANNVQEGNSFLSDLRQSASFVMTLLDENSEIGNRLAEAISGVSELLEKLSTLLGDVEDTASEIELIAINAQIRAARMTGFGAALGVLAKAIRNLSDTTMSQTQVMARTIEDLNRTAVELRADSRRGNYQTGVGIAVAEMKTLLNSLGESEGELTSLLADFKNRTKELHDEVEALIRHISAHTRTDSVVDGIIEGLQKIVNRRPAGACRATNPNVERLARLAERYTMHQERSVHQTHVNRTTGSCSTFDENGFADNVELF